MVRVATGSKETAKPCAFTWHFWAANLGLPSRQFPWKPSQSLCHLRTQAVQRMLRSDFIHGEFWLSHMGLPSWKRCALRRVDANRIFVSRFYRACYQGSWSYGLQLRSQGLFGSGNNHFPIHRLQKMVLFDCWDFLKRGNLYINLRLFFFLRKLKSLEHLSHKMSTCSVEKKG